MQDFKNYLTYFFTNPINANETKNVKLTITTLAPDGKLGNKKKASRKLVIDINAEVITSIYTQDIVFKERIPLIIQIVHGKVPDFSMDTKKD